MPHLVAQQTQTPGFGVAFHFHHHLGFEALKARMGEVERDSDGRRAFRAKPLVAQIADRFERDAAGVKLGVEFIDARLKLGAGDLELQVANAHLQQRVVVERG